MFPTANSGTPSTVDADTMSTTPKASTGMTAAAPSHHGFISWFMNDVSMMDRLVLALVIMLAIIAVFMLAKRVYGLFTSPVDASKYASYSAAGKAHGFNTMKLTGDVNHDDTNDAMRGNRKPCNQ